MIEFMTALFHALQGGYHMAEAAYYAGPLLRDGALALAIVVLGAVFIRGR